jgi:putative FmdB family regulatory protein
MPIYDYECPKCGWTFESIESIASEKIPCVECSGRAHRQMSAPIFVIRGYSEANGYCKKGE